MSVLLNIKTHCVGMDRGGTTQTRNTLYVKRGTSKNKNTPLCECRLVLIKIETPHVFKRELLKIETI